MQHSDFDTAAASWASSSWWYPDSAYLSMSDSAQLSPSATSNPLIDTSPPSSPQPASSPLPQSHEVSSSSSSSSIWSLVPRPLVLQGSESLPDWITGLASLAPTAADLQRQLSMSPLLSTTASFFVPPTPSVDAASMWGGVASTPFATSIAHSSLSSAPTTSTMFAAPHLSSSAMQLLKTSSSSSFTSSSDSSPASSSPSASSSSYSSGLRPRRRYQRLTGLSLEQRMERRRRSHRELDAVRRHREALAISRLEQLTAHKQRTHLLPQPHPQAFTYTTESVRTPPEEGERAAMGPNEKDKRHRTAVLENSVEKMEELQQLVNQLTATCTQQSYDIASLRLQLQPLGQPPPSPTGQLVIQAVELLSAANVQRVVSGFGVASLYSMLFDSVSVGVLLVDCGSGLVVDVNDRLLAGAFCTREDIIGRQVVPGYQTVTSLSAWDSQPAGEPASRGQVRGQPAMVYSQYGTTQESVLALYRGQVDQVHVVWRAQLGDGLAYELPLSGFVASRDEADGGRPRTVAVILSLSEAERI